MFLRKLKLLATIAAVITAGTAANAHDGVIVKATSSGANGVYSFNVTLEHGDTGWDHYANVWEVLDDNGNVLGRRELAHPHENEQPFTRSLGRVKIPDGVTSVVIRAGDNVSGNWTTTLRHDLPTQ